MYKFISKSPPADWQTGMGPAFHWAGITLGRHCIGMLAGRPKIRRETTRCRQLCDDYIPCTLFKGNYLIQNNKMCQCVNVSYGIIAKALHQPTGMGAMLLLLCHSWHWRKRIAPIPVGAMLLRPQGWGWNRDTLTVDSSAITLVQRKLYYCNSPAPCTFL